MKLWIPLLILFVALVLAPSLEHFDGTSQTPPQQSPVTSFLYALLWCILSIPFIFIVVFILNRYFPANV